MELKEFEVGLGQMFEDGSPVVIAVDENNNPRLLGKEKVYLKYEADEVIAELKHDVENWMGSYEASRRVNARYESKLRHSNYKRCLDKAKWCASEEGRLEAIAPLFGTDKECWEYNLDYWAKWRERWLELAEKFRDNEAK